MEQAEMREWLPGRGVGGVGGGSMTPKNRGGESGREEGTMASEREKEEESIGSPKRVDLGRGDHFEDAMDECVGVVIGEEEEKERADNFGLVGTKEKLFKGSRDELEKERRKGEVVDSSEEKDELVSHEMIVMVGFTVHFKRLLNGSSYEYIKT